MATSSMIYNLSNNDFMNILNSIEPKENVMPHLNVIKYTTKSNNSYNIIRYNKNILSTDLIPDYGLYRSVIINSEKKVVSFAPPKSIYAEDFMKKYPVIDDNIVVEEFIEGTMINVFWDTLIGSWQIATRSTIGGDVSFYKGSKTFSTMFNEALLECKLKLGLLNPSYCYSFVLQHPDNRIVTPFIKPSLYLIGIYYIENVEGLCPRVHVMDIEPSMFEHTAVRFPRKYTEKTYSDAIEKYASGNTDYRIVGVMIHNKVTGERCKIRNPMYEEVRQLKGNQPKLQYQYLCLRQQNKVAEFLKFYGEHKREFSKFRDQVHMFTDTLFTNYVSCYIRKEKPLNQYPSQYKTHMFKLHEHYLTNLKPNNLFITNTEAIKYVNQLHPSILMHGLNYNFKKQTVDTIKAELS
jgi:hypothetical protein